MNLKDRGSLKRGSKLNKYLILRLSLSLCIILIISGIISFSLNKNIATNVSVNSNSAVSLDGSILKLANITLEDLYAGADSFFE